MKQLFTLLLLSLFLLPLHAQEHDSFSVDMEDLMTLRYYDSIEASLVYRYDTLVLGDNIATVSIPSGFKFLDATQAHYVLTDLWGNPPRPNMTLGMIVPEDQGVMDDDGWVFNIEYDNIGYVEDNDAEEIDYDELLEEMQKGETETNAERTGEGYPEIHTLGWAQPPFYDKEKNILHWAYEIQFGDIGGSTLNYNIRLLGRKGVLIINAISDMQSLPEVKQNIPEVLSMVQFTDGNRYGDFNPDLDEVAAWTIGGLVAGKILAKAGVAVFLLKFWKIIALGAAAIGGGIWKYLSGRKKEEEEEEPA